MKTVLIKGFIPVVTTAVLALSCGPGIAWAAPAQQALSPTLTLSLSVQSQDKYLPQWANSSPSLDQVIASGPLGYIDTGLAAVVPYLHVHLNKETVYEVKKGLIVTTALAAGIAVNTSTPYAGTAARAVSEALGGYTAIVAACTNKNGDADVYFVGVPVPFPSTPLPIPVCNPFAR